jgi:hypothetical protein
MNQEDQNILFQPIITACLTNAVYTCQLLSEDMKNNPDAALQSVLLTYHRIIELMSKQSIQTANANVQLGIFVRSLLEKSEQSLQHYSALAALTEKQQQEKYMLDGQIILLMKIADFLKKTQS